MSEKEGFPRRDTPSSNAFFDQPDDCYDMVNQYGTYEIQRTADTENPFPMIAQGLPRAESGRRLEKEDLLEAGRRMQEESREEAARLKKQSRRDLTNEEGPL